MSKTLCDEKRSANRNEIVRGNRRMYEYIGCLLRRRWKISHDEFNIKSFTNELKLVRQHIYSDFIERLDEEPTYMENIVRWDVTWIF